MKTFESQSAAEPHELASSAAAAEGMTATLDAARPEPPSSNARPSFERLATAAELAEQARLREQTAADERAMRARGSMDLSLERQNLERQIKDRQSGERAPFRQTIDRPDDAERIELYRMHSAVLPDDRVITVYLPPQYAAEPDRRFPVFYMHDGQNLFDPMTSYIPGRTWRAGSTADQMNRDGTAEPVILVGIANTGLRRMAEYTPTRDPRMGGGDGELYTRLLAGELKPFIDRSYRTHADAASTGVGGSSLGGLISLYMGFCRPDVFGRVAVLSPSIWWDQRSILRLVGRTQPTPKLRIWLDIGTAEGWRHVRDTERLAQMLRERGWQDGVDLGFMLVEGGVHDEDAWAARFDRVLSFLFPPQG